MKKDIWNVKPGEIAIIGGERYRHNRDYKIFMPTLGYQLNREMINIDDGSKQLFTRKFVVEIETAYG